MNENKQAETEQIQPIDKEALATFETLMDKVPEPSGDAYGRIIEQIANATKASELDSPWSTDSFLKLDGKEILVNGITKVPSDYPGGLPWFLVVDYTDKDTGEECTATTGSVAVVMQLVKAYILKALPLSVQVIVAERETRNGFHPVHLRIVR